MPQDGARAMQQLPFGSSMGPGQAIPSGPGGMPQGQQPILNVGSPRLTAGCDRFIADLLPPRMRLVIWTRLRSSSTSSRTSITGSLTS
jgi:hypothetical protein